jgi:hypothetical protein
MKKKIKAQVFTRPDGSELYGYAHPIVHNEIKKGSKLQMNTDVPPQHSLHSAEAMETAARSLKD